MTNEELLLVKLQEVMKELKETKEIVQELKNQNNIQLKQDIIPVWIRDGYDNKNEWVKNQTPQ